MSAAADRRHLQRELATHLREKDRASLALLRARIDAARVSRRGLVHGARQSCKVARESLKLRQAEERQALTAQHQAERVAERVACSSGKDTARTTGRTAEADAKRALRDERIFQRRIDRAGKTAPRPGVRSTTARERKQEDDERVSSNLPPELRPVWEKFKKHIKGSDRRSRTEAFLEWAEENPDEIIAVQSEAADRELAQLLKAEKELGRSVRSARRYRATPEELSELLAGVPF